MVGEVGGGVKFSRERILKIFRNPASCGTKRVQPRWSGFANLVCRLRRYAVSKPRIRLSGLLPGLPGSTTYRVRHCFKVERTTRTWQREDLDEGSKSTFFCTQFHGNLAKTFPHKVRQESHTDWPQLFHT